MKIKLLLFVGFGFVASSLVAQKAVFYNQGEMSISSAGVDGVTLYIDGDFVAGRDANNNSIVSRIVLDNSSKTILTGDFVHDLNGGSVSTNIFEQGSSGVAGFKGSQFIFRGTSAQSIKLAEGLTYGEYPQSLKGLNYINFPTLVVENDKHVTIAPELAAQASSLTLNTGRLILDSRRADQSDDFKNVTPGLHSADASTMLAHFMVASDGEIKTDNAKYKSQSDNNKFGAVQVNLVLDDSTKVNDQIGRSLVGMGSPFAQLGVDYFAWNHLFLPQNESILNGTTVDAKSFIGAGRGFIVGMDLRGKDEARYTPNVDQVYLNLPDKPKFTERAKDGYSFSRFGEFFTNSNNHFQANGWGGRTGASSFLSSTGLDDNAYVGEVLNFKDVSKLPIEKGYNYYSNPYTVPLSLEDLAKNTAAADWGVTTGGSGSTTRDLSNQIWILDPSSVGSALYDVTTSPGTQLPVGKITVNSKYRVIRPDAGSTAPQSDDYDPGTGAGGDLYTIAPLQMFVMFAPNATGKKLTIPAKARQISQNSLFLRSTPKSGNYKDDFLFNVKDEKSNASDRTAIVIRTPQEVMTNAGYGATDKLIALITSDATTTKSTTEVGAVTQTNLSTIYTKSDSGRALESNVLGVPMNTESETVTLFVTPSLIAQNISISTGRLETADRVQGIMLKDKVTNKEFDLFGGKTYTTTSKATDPADRFTVKFILKSTSGIEGDKNNSDSKSITSYYSNGTLTVTGFEDADFGSVVSVYDIQGRMTAQAKVNDTTVEITQPFSQGAYIVKVVGNKSYAAKFLVK